MLCYLKTPSVVAWLSSFLLVLSSWKAFWLEISWMTWTLKNFSAFRKPWVASQYVSRVIIHLDCENPVNQWCGIWLRTEYSPERPRIHLVTSVSNVTSSKKKVKPCVDSHTRSWCNPAANMFDMWSSMLHRPFLLQTFLFATLHFHSENVSGLQTLTSEHFRLFVVVCCGFFHLFLWSPRSFDVVDLTSALSLSF